MREEKEMMKMSIKIREKMKYKIPPLSLTILSPPLPPNPSHTGADPRVLLPAGDVRQLEPLQAGCHGGGPACGRCGAAALGHIPRGVCAHQQNGT